MYGYYHVNHNYLAKYHSEWPLRSRGFFNNPNNLTPNPNNVFVVKLFTIAAL